MGRGAMDVGLDGIHGELQCLIMSCSQSLLTGNADACAPRLRQRGCSKKIQMGADWMSAS